MLPTADSANLFPDFDAFEEPEYLQKFGLNEPPYSTNADERYLYLTGIHKDAMRMCGRLIKNREGAGLVSGEFGTGKTTIMRRLYSQMKDAGSFRVGVIEAVEHSPTLFQLVKEVLEAFGQECIGRDTKTRVDQFKDFLIDAYEGQIPAVLLVDEAHKMTGSQMEILRSFLNFENPLGGKMLQIILFAQPPIERKFKYASSFANRLTKFELRRMDRTEMENMLRWRFIQAGGAMFPFAQDAMDILFDLSDGNPRTICGMAHLALDESAEKNLPIDAELIQHVASQRVLPHQH